MRLLIIEDNSIEAELLAAAVKGSYKDVDIAYNLEQAKGLIRKEGHECIMVDLDLPDSEGLDTLRAVIHAHAAMPKVLVITGMDIPNLKERCIDLGASALLKKDGLHIDDVRREANRLLDTPVVIKLKNTIPPQPIKITEPLKEEPQVAEKPVVSKLSSFVKDWKVVVVAAIFILGGGGAQFLYQNLYADSVDAAIDSVFTPLEMRVDTIESTLKGVVESMEAVEDGQRAQHRMDSKLWALLNEMASDEQRATARSKLGFAND